MSRLKYINSKLPVLWHGGDYNPEQWAPQVWTEDARLMEEAAFRVATLGVFSWAKLEPREGQFEFGWLDEVIERLAERDRYFILATPSAAPPAWMARAYPEILRTGPDRVRRLHGNRVNYSLCSPIYREKTRDMARRLAERYGGHPRLLAWHVSNEYGGEDYSPETIAAFRLWLREKYGTLEALNAAYWAAFWSHTYSDWEEIDAPGEPYGETAVHGLTVDWKRFTTDATVEFMLNEMAPLRELSPEVPVTTNFMGTFPGLDYRKLASHLDFISWDSYPAFVGPLDETETWVAAAFKHDLTRGMATEGRWMLMECSPSSSNWYPSMELKRPGMHRFEALQAVAHGADGVQYFQWRQSRGGQEQYHGAVVSHGTGSSGRVFREVQAVGRELDGLAALTGSRFQAEVAVVFDWPCMWALDAASGPVQRPKGYERTCIEHYRAFWEAGIPVDVIGMEDALEGYRLVVAPMAYSLVPGFAERVERFVTRGGTFLTTYLSGWTDENSLVFEEGYLGPLRRVLGIESEELDALPPNRRNRIEFTLPGISGSFEARDFCEIVKPTTARVVGAFGEDFFAGGAAVTVNELGTGRAYYVAARGERASIQGLLREIASEAGLEPLVKGLPEGVTATCRRGEKGSWLFLMNATSQWQAIQSDGWGEVALAPWDVRVLPLNARQGPESSAQESEKVAPAP